MQGDFLSGVFLWSMLGPFLICAFVAALFAVTGVVCSPFVAVVCGKIARNKGMGSWNVLRYGLIGAFYTVMLGFPGLFLAMGLNGRNISRSLVRLTYILPFGIWGGCSLAWLVAGVFLTMFDEAVYLLVIPAVSLLLCGMSAALLWGNKGVGSLSEWGNPTNGIIPYPRYVNPFAGATVFLIAACGLLWWLVANSRFF